MSNRILVVAAHPDDEVLGCGATLARHCSEGREVHVLILCEGVTSRDETRDAETRRTEIAALKTSAELAAKALGTQPPLLAGLPDNRLDSIPLIDVIKQVERVVRDIRPAIVYTHHGGDLNVDHRIAHQAVMTACRPVPKSFVAEIYAFETASSTEWSDSAIGAPFIPSRFVDVGEWMEKKILALGAYGSEMRPFPHARSLAAIQALARWRGSTVGVEAAEAFVTIRQLVAAF
jgi:LmbE family N-acetylglucosaminyl deacetylase